MGYIYFLTKSLFSTMMNFAINLRVELYTIGFDFIVQMFKIIFFSFIYACVSWVGRARFFWSLSLRLAKLASN